MIDEPILIVGAPRSGTSLVSGIFAACGAFAGRTCGKTAWNAKGQYENGRIRKAIKRLLESEGFDPLGQDHLPPRSHMWPQNDLADTIMAETMQAGFSGDRYLIKDPKLCLVWRTLRDAFPNALWVLVHRSVQDISDSCAQTGFMRERGNRTKLEGLAREYQLRMCDIYREVESNVGGAVASVYPDDIVAGNMLSAFGAVDQAGLEWNQQAVNNWIEPSLWRARRDG